MWRSTFSRPALVTVPLALYLSAGCGPAGDAVPVIQVGRIDASLPAEMQARQRAIKDLFDALLYAETDFERLGEYRPDVQLRESRASFFAGGNDLFGWKFDGPPRGNNVPVVVYLELGEEGQPVGGQNRVYTVTLARPVVIARKQ